MSVCVDAQQVQEEDVLIFKQTGPQTGVELGRLEEGLTQEKVGLTY